MNGKNSGKNRKICLAHIALRLASFCLAVCVSVFAVGRSLNVLAAESSSVRSELSGPSGFGFVYLKSYSNMYPLSYTQTNVSNNVTSNYLKWSFPLEMGVKTYHNAGTYLNGYLDFSFVFNFDNRDIFTDYSRIINASSGVFGDGLSYKVQITTDNAMRVVVLFDNYRVQNSVSVMTDWTFDVIASYREQFIGQCNLSVTGTYLSGSVEASDSPSNNLSSIISGAINGSSSVSDILILLNSVKDDVSLLNDVCIMLDVSNTALAEIVSNITTENSAFYWLLVNAIKNANDSQAPVVKDEIVQDMENIGSSMDSGHDVEQGLIDDMDNSLSNIDFNFISSAPTTVAGAAPWVVGLIYNIWSYMGPLQYLMTCALTLGLAFVLMAEINKKNKS